MTFAKRDLGDVHALIASSGPPIAWSLVEFARQRRVDAILDAVCDAWNRLIGEPAQITSIGSLQWAATGQT
jgi:hypothetical protein